MSLNGTGKVGSLELTDYEKNLLRRHGITQVSQLAAMTAAQLLALPDVGPDKVRRFARALRKSGQQLAT